jgi:hypothetical protein
MNDLTPALLPILLVVTGLVVIGLWHASLLECFRQVFVRPLNLLTNARDGLRAARTVVLDHAADLRRDEGLTSTGRLLQRAFGVLLFTVLTLIFSINDIHLANLFFEGRGFAGEAAAWTTELTGWLDLNLIISMGIWSAYILAGATVMDLLGVTHLMPQPDTRAYRVLAWSAALLLLILAFTVNIALGLDRGLETSTPPAMTAGDGSSMAALLDASTTAGEAPERPYFNEISNVVFLGHAGLMFLGTLVSFTGLVQLPILAWLLLLVLPLCVLVLIELPLMVIHALAEWLAGIGVSAAQFGLNLARLLASPIGRLLGDEWCETHLPVGAPAPWVDAAAVAEGAKGAADTAPVAFAADPGTPPASPDTPQGPAGTAFTAGPSHNWDPYGHPAPSPHPVV